MGKFVSHVNEMKQNDGVLGHIFGAKKSKSGGDSSG